ncbi:MAG: peptidase M23 protein [uncultured bacterium]|nr:MAG: peptidase M23 protein [uncultured bacterium]
MKTIYRILLISILILQISPALAKQTQLVGPVLGGISSNYGYRADPFSGITKSHDGIDIAAAYGAPIYAVQDGYVTRSGWRGGYGLAITIDHHYPDIPGIPRIQTTYGHNSYNYVKVGEYVRRGQVIGLVGSTGRSTGPHLHFEVTYKGRPYPPIDYLTKLPSYVAYIDQYRARTQYTSNKYSNHGQINSYR